MAKLYQALRAEIVQLTPETPLVKTLVLRPEQSFAFAPGQFVELLIPGRGEAPFTPVSSPDQTSQIEITVMKRGRLTELIHQLEPGAIVGIRGPYGKGYPLEQFSGKELLLMSGGVGIAGFKALLFALFNQIENYPRVILLYGAKTARDLVYQGWLSEKQKRNLLDAHLIVEDGGWDGKKGLVTDLLKEIQLEPDKSLAVLCGPDGMMKAATLDLMDRGFKPGQIYLSMEKNMSCGIGKCGHCRLGNFYVCRDGPVFSYGRLDKIPDLWG